MKTKKKPTEIPTILMSFNGNQDPFASSGSEGPVLSLVSEKKWDKVILFYTSANEEKAMQTKAEILARAPSVEVIPIVFPIEDPTDYRSILDGLREGFAEIHESGAQYYISASSGTPAMHACWLLLASSGEIPARVIQTRNPRYIREGQERVTEIDPRERFFPVVEQRIAMKSLPPLNDDIFQAALQKAGIIGSHPDLREALEVAAKVARTDETILVLGESGTGKELFARFIHEVSLRREKAFIPVNCGAIPENLIESELFGARKGAYTGASADKIGIFEAADGGSVFLDEIGDLPLHLQVKLLRTIENGEIQVVGAPQSKKVNVRIIAATNAAIQKAVADGRFREDLYYRISSFIIRLPTLNQRRTDIPVLSRHFFSHYRKKFQKDLELSQEAIFGLQNHHWKGNIRELRNIIKRLVLLTDGELIDGDDLQRALEIDAYGEEDRSACATDSDLFQLPEPREGFSLGQYLEQTRDQMIRKALEITGGNQKLAAKLLGMTGANISKHLKNNPLY